jgi:hypothetical protein
LHAGKIHGKIQQNSKNYIFNDKNMGNIDKSSDKKQNQKNNESLLNLSNVSKSFYGQGQNINYPLNSNSISKKEYCKEHKEELTYFNIQKYMNKHFIKNAEI